MSSLDAVLPRLHLDLQKRTADETFSGVVLVADHGQPIFREAYGLASRAYAAPNTVKTRFSIASITKMFTSVAIMQLAARGLLRMDDVLAEYLPDWPSEVGRRVTLHHLLTNTSGYGDPWEHPDWSLERNHEIRRVEQMVSILREQEPAFKPGTEFCYSDGGYMLLGAVIEAVTGEDYYSYVTEHVLRAAGMHDSGFLEPDLDPPDMATGYNRQPLDGEQVGSWRHTRRFDTKGMPSGGAFATADDLLSFASALRGHRLITEEDTQRILSGHIDFPFFEYGVAQYGYGSILATRGGRRYIGHVGGAPGSSSDFGMLPDSGGVVVVLANMEGAALPVMDFILESLPV